MDTCLIGMRADRVIRDTDSDPYGTLFLGTFTNHFENPDLVLISDCKGFPRAIIAVVPDKVRHRADCLTSTLRALQSDINETSVVHDALGVRELLASTPRTLGDGYLVFVHVPDDVVGDGGLGDEAQRLACIPLMHLEHKPLTPRLGWVMDKIAIERVRVSRIANHHRAICRSLLTHDEIGASLGGLREK